jgi:hypothetical protein
MADAARSEISSTGFSLIRPRQGKPQSREHQDLKSEQNAKLLKKSS